MNWILPTSRISVVFSSGTRGVRHVNTNGSDWLLVLKICQVVCSFQLSYFNFCYFHCAVPCLRTIGSHRGISPPRFVTQPHPVLSASFHNLTERHKVHLWSVSLSNCVQLIVFSPVEIVVFAFPYRSPRSPLGKRSIRWFGNYSWKSSPKDLFSSVIKHLLSSF